MCNERQVKNSEMHFDSISARRKFLMSAGASAVASSVWVSQKSVACASSLTTHHAIEPTAYESPKTPEEAIAALMAGNKRFAEGQSLAIHRDIARVRAVAKEQRPYAAFLGCADSRVPIEIVFDQGFGDLFVTRIAGNIASSENIGSLEFGTQVLGAKVLFVLGHTDCGAVNATMKGVEVPGQISGLFQYIRPAVKSAKGDLTAAIVANVRNQANLLSEASPVIAKLIQRKELIVAGGIYDLASGVVTTVALD